MTYKKSEDLTDEERHHELIYGVVAWTIMILVILYKHNSLDILLNDLKNIWFISVLIIIIIFTIFCWKSQNERLRISSEKGCVALLIAYMARLDFVLATYFIIFIFSYYATDDFV